MATRTQRVRKWTVAEGYEALKSGDPAARQDIARRFPLFATASAEEIVAAVEILTVRQMEKQLRNAAGISAPVDEDETPAKPEKKAPKAKPAKPVVEDEDDEDEDEDDEDFDPEDLFDEDEDDDA